MVKIRTEYYNKIYYWFPGGELQYGKLSKSWVLWLGKKRIILKKGKS